ncbi:MAG TPA: alpha/beta hydrolase [Mucilaginibacter sp.]|jgi:esterase/lipase superfamily enzyme|nr:alpha/beta hydrolase [Mucilaginibacter sp.]
MSNSNLPALLPEANYYGIQLEDTEFRSWENSGESTSQLVYHWEKIKANIYDQKQNIQIAVAKYFHNDDIPVSAIKNMANSIRQTKDLHENDRIFGVNRQNIDKVGYISRKKVIENQEVALTIEWIPEGPLGEVKRPLFHEDAELQPLNPYEVKLIEEQFPEQLQLIYRQMPEISYQGEDQYKRIASDEYEFARNLEKESILLREAKVDQGGSMTVFYGTNRNRLEYKDGIQSYGEVETRELKFGTCEVHIPRKHRQGNIERPGALERFFGWPESEKRHFVIKSTGEMSEEFFLADFIKTLNEKPKKQGLLFIHGYHTTFDEAAYRAGQLAWDLPFKGYTGFFSWPSAGKLSAYGADDAAARSSAPILKDFIAKIAATTELEQLHIVAHSMGGLILTISLNILAADTDKAIELEKIYQLVLGAPDIDKGEFFNVILPALNKIGKQRTLYASDHDEALNTSASLRSLRDRLGQIGTGIFVADGLDSVNASNLGTKDSHSYVFEDKELLSDLYHIVNNGLSPEERRLREMAYTPVNYWLFPE